MTEEETGECLCRLIDADLIDAVECPVHGPSSEAQQRAQEREVEADEANWWRDVESM